MKTIYNLAIMDVFTKKKRSEIMSRIRSKDTAPELMVRRLLHREGFRYRLHTSDLPGCPDIVLKRHKTVIFINGCFWHGHGECLLFSTPRTKKSYWLPKIDRNRERDAKTKKELLKIGWKVATLWECALRSKSRLTEDAIKYNLLNFIKDKDRHTIEIRGRRIKKI